jgi:hypothetical protein
MYSDHPAVNIVSLFRSLLRYVLDPCQSRRNILQIIVGLFTTSLEMIISAPDKPQETQDPHPLPTESVLPGPPPSAPVKPTTKVTRRRRLRLAIYSIVLLLLAFAIHSTRRRSHRPPKVFYSRPPFQPKQRHFTPTRLPHIEKTFLYGYRLVYSYPNLC